jgi:hypothetical protein
MRYSETSSTQSHTQADSPPEPGRRWRALETVALICYLLPALGYCVMIVPGGGPDEAEHVDYVRSLARQGQLPALPGSSLALQPDRVQTSQAQHPPLYYLLMAPLYRLAGSQQSFYVAGRLLGVLLGLAGLLMTRAAVRISFPERPEMTAFALIIASGMTTYTYITSTVNNEMLAIFLVCAGWWALAWGLHTRRTMATILLLGALLGLALLVKLTGTVLVVTLAVAAAALTAKDQPDREADDISDGTEAEQSDCPAPATALPPPPPATKRSFGNRLLTATKLTAIGLLVAAVLSGWWLVRNSMVYGTPLPRTHVRPMAPNASAVLFLPEVAFPWMAVIVEETLWGIWLPWWLVRYGPGLMVALIHEDFAVSPALTLIRPEAVLAPLAVLLILLLGLRRAWRSGRLTARQKWLLAAVLGGMIWLMAGLYYQLMFVDAQVTYFIARYLPVMLPGLAVALAVGAAELMPERKRWAGGWILQATMAAFSGYVWWLVAVAQVYVH